AAGLIFEERDLRSNDKKKKPFDQGNSGLSAKQLAEPAHVSSATWAVGLMLLIIAFIVLFCWYTDWNPFAYFMSQEQPSTPLLNNTRIVDP
ncbi:MAG: hypothetical protein D3924_09515, partial [Candidatus Electrothrix sp. AR4]|nr:hypothetical protein [Candidatus Electrothrix sp. AR4]